MSHRFVLTGAPGAGKTSVLRALQGRGWAVVPEAATDIIAGDHRLGVDEPWLGPDFTERIVALQRERQERRSAAEVQFYDRSPLCTLALALHLRQRGGPMLADEVARVVREQVYERTVFFVRPLGFLVPTAARRISYDESLVFEAVHEQVYRDHGFDIVDVPLGSVLGRATAIESHLSDQPAGTRSADPPG